MRAKHQQLLSLVWLVVFVGTKAQYLDVLIRPCRYIEHPPANILRAEITTTTSLCEPVVEAFSGLLFIQILTSLMMAVLYIAVRMPSLYFSHIDNGHLSLRPFNRLLMIRLHPFGMLSCLLAPSLLTTGDLSLRSSLPAGICGARRHDTIFAQGQFHCRLRGQLIGDVSPY